MNTDLLNSATDSITLTHTNPGAPHAAYSTIIVTASFGNPPPGGGLCTGKGFCQVSISNYGANNTVAFQVSPIDRNVLIMSFSLSELKRKQPEQMPYFTNSGSYDFDAPYSLAANQAFAPLGLHRNARIDKNSSSKVVIMGDLVTTFIMYSHD